MINCQSCHPYRHVLDFLIFGVAYFIACKRDKIMADLCSLSSLSAPRLAASWVCIHCNTKNNLVHINHLECTKHWTVCLWARKDLLNCVRLQDWKTPIRMRGVLSNVWQVTLVQRVLLFILPPKVHHRFRACAGVSMVTPINHPKQRCINYRTLQFPIIIHCGFSFKQ